MARSTDAEIVFLLRSRIGRLTSVVTADGEPMVIKEVVQTTAPSQPAAEFIHYAERGGIALSADDGRYFFYSNEVARIEDVVTGDVIFDRDAS